MPPFGHFSLIRFAKEGGACVNRGTHDMRARAAG
jgi:hypothetical protein